ncbi:hypothetical protein JKP88DRAFT_266290 [Tribonema minus]|uniref:Sulfotransferase domain-containing protein n=1 Tax=Tribonema minus TaxID=303371 RepID=A0A835ZEH8_9STRA|nr:hypothetical protein JKP88DRAFT_266290 [Tribonema minus]
MPVSSASPTAAASMCLAFASVQALHLHQCLRAQSCSSVLAPMLNLEPALLAMVPYCLFRCGNTLMRRLLEKATGVITGSDTRPDRTLSRSLAAFGLQGEGVTDFKRVLLVKTHWPERQGWKRFTAQRAILLVRNPFDAIDSYFNMALTNTHDKSLHEQVYRMFGDIWDGLVHNEMDIWQRFYEFWLSVKVPLLLVRYEDLVQHTDQVTACMERAGHMIEAFGYDPRSQNFPHGHTTTQLQPLECCLRNVPIQDCAHQSGDMLHKVAGNGSDAALAVLHVNAGQLIRSADDMFGRRMTELRKQHTDNDTKPLPLAA